MFELECDECDGGLIDISGSFWCMECSMEVYTLVYLRGEKKKGLALG